MFIVNKERKVWWPIEGELVAPDGGTSKFSFDVQFKLLTRQQMREKLRTSNKAANELKEISSVLQMENVLENILDEDKTEESDRFILDHCCDWRKIVDEDENETPFSIDAIKALMDRYPSISLKIETGLWNASMDAPTKN